MRHPIAVVVLAAVLAGCPTPRPTPRRTPPPAKRAQPDPDARGDFQARLRTTLREQMKPYRRRLRRCHELAMAQDYKVGGRLQVALHIAPAGTVVDVKVLANPTGSKLLFQCVAHVARNFVFPASDASHQLPMALRFRAPKEKYTVRLDDVPPVKVVGRAVTAKRLLHPKSVSGDRIAMAVVRFEKGAKLRLSKGGLGVAGYVLQGTLEAQGRGRKRFSRGAVFSGHRGRYTQLANVGAGRAAVVLFFGSGAREAHSLAGGALPTTSHPPPRTIQRVVLQPGRRAVIPAARGCATALLVTGGAFWVTLKGVKLPAEAGMALYIPAGSKATITPAIRRQGTFVLGRQCAFGPQGLPTEKALMPPPLRRPRRGPGVRIPGMP